MKVSEIQAAIFEQTGLKTSAKKMTGSMKHHVKVWPIFQGGKYPSFSLEWARDFVKQFNPDLQNDCFPYGSTGELNIPITNFTEIDPVTYKKERKAKPIDQMNVKQWGSKNSQLRLDKASRRTAKIPLWQKQ